MKIERIVYGMAAGFGIWWVLRGLADGSPQIPGLPPGAPPGVSGTERKILAYSEVVKQAALTHMVDPALLCAIMERESGGKADARGAAGEVGLMQILPSTGLSSCGASEAMLWDIPTNINCGAKYLALTIKLLSSVPGGVAGYNCGPGRVGRELVTQKFIVPNSTRRYALAVLSLSKRYRQIWQGLMPEYKLYFPDYPWAVTGAGSFVD